MNRRTALAGILFSLSLCSMVLLTVAGAGAASRETPDDIQIDDLVAQAKTKADHLKIAGLYMAEAKAEDDKAKQLQDQAEAYKAHKHDVYGRNILDLIEHTEALAQNYQESANRHEYLAQIHEQIAADTKH
jgi:hypothetical protein